MITQLIPVAGNEDMLANIPHKQIEDLALVYRFSVGRDEHGQSTILVKNDMLDRYGITAEQLHEDAMMSAPQIEEPSMKTLFETTVEIMGEDFFELMGEVEPAMPGVYVCTNESMHHGASVLMYPDFMDEDDLYNDDLDSYLDPDDFMDEEDLYDDDPYNDKLDD